MVMVLLRGRVAISFGGIRDRPKRIGLPLKNRPGGSIWANPGEKQTVLQANVCIKSARPTSRLRSRFN